ncbi:Alpha/Beta hydrolase protein, partial [Pterulicium gracile]
MEAIAKITTYDDILSLLIPSAEAFAPILRDSPLLKQYISTRKTFQFGTTDRHQLDVYYPPPTSTAAPVLFYSYGGGFVAGARTLSHPASEALSLGYGNVGSYFAYKGFVTIIADYRLAPAFRYPAAAIDVRDAVEWVFQNQDAIVNGSDVKALDKERVFILGASAGAAHVITALLSPDVSPVGVRLAGIATLGGAFALADEEKTTRNVDAYWGSQELARRTQPLTLVQEQRERVKEMPPWLFIEAENEPEFVKAGGKLTREALHGRQDVPHLIAKGHNHISVTFSLGTGNREGEEWADEFVRWM